MRTPILTLGVVVALVASAPVPGEAQRSDSRPEVEQTSPDVVVEVGGLSCPFCAYGIEKKFVEREAVDSVFVELQEGEVHLWLEPERKLSDATVRETVRDAGFTAGAIRRPEPGGPGAR